MAAFTAELHAIYRKQEWIRHLRTVEIIDLKVILIITKNKLSKRNVLTHVLCLYGMVLILVTF